MIFSDQYCTKEQAEKLFNLGVISNTPDVLWIENESIRSLGTNPDGVWHCLPMGYAETLGYANSFTAFSVAELGIMLPVNCATFRTTEDTFVLAVPFQKSTTEAKLRAGALIAMLELGAITLEEVNQRLNS